MADMPRKLIPDLIIDQLVAEHGRFQDVDGTQAQELSNAIAAVLLPEDANFRTSMYALARVLGWVAFLVQEKITPEDLIKSVTEQSMNFYRAFQDRSPTSSEKL